MDKNRTKGIGKQVSGSIKTEAEGAAQKTSGKAQNAVGGAKDKVRDELSD